MLVRAVVCVRFDLTSESCGVVNWHEMLVV